jgi:threonine synthase
MTVVSDSEILSAIPEMARRTGVFGEPAGAAAFAGFRRMAREGRMGRDEKVAVVVTGNGLKDIDSAKKAVGTPMVSAPDLEDFNRQLERSGLQC